MAYSTDVTSLDDLLARAAIESAVKTYSMAMDQRAWDDYTDLFTPEVDLQFPETTQGLRGVVPAADWVAVVRRTISGFSSAQHVISNILVERRAFTATARAYLLVTHTLDVDGVLEKHRFGGFYTFGLTGSNGGWKISSINLDISWDEGRWELFDIAGARFDASER